MGLEEVAKVEDVVSSPEVDIGNHHTEAARAKLVACEGPVEERFAIVAGVADGSFEDLPRETGGLRHGGWCEARREHADSAPQVDTAMYLRPECDLDSTRLESLTSVRIEDVCIRFSASPLMTMLTYCLGHCHEQLQRWTLYRSDNCMANLYMVT